MRAVFFQLFPGFQAIGRWNSPPFFGMLVAGFHFTAPGGLPPATRAGVGCREGSYSMTLTMYGIKNCDTIKKARRWLEEQGVAYHFHDYRADGLDEQQLRGFVELLGWEPLLNTRGTTWRKLDEAQRNACDNADAAIELMLAQPAIIKRPLLSDGKGHALLGFNADSYQQFISEVAA
jgi:Spx/MgsR family transcriptional regulator